MVETISCEEFMILTKRDLLELTPARREALKQHFFSCEGCRTAIESVAAAKMRQLGGVMPSEVKEKVDCLVQEQQEWRMLNSRRIYFTVTMVNGQAELLGFGFTEGEARNGADPDRCCVMSLLAEMTESEVHHQIARVCWWLADQGFCGVEVKEHNSRLMKQVLAKLKQVQKQIEVLEESK